LSERRFALLAGGFAGIHPCNLFPALRPAQARTRDRRCPSRSGRGKAPQRAIAVGRRWRGRSRPRWPLALKTLGRSCSWFPAHGCPWLPWRRLQARRGVVGRSVVVPENRGDCRSRQERLTCPAPGCEPRTTRRAQPFQAQARSGEAQEADPAAAKPRGRWRAFCGAQATQSAPVEGRRPGPGTACLLTEARRTRPCRSGSTA